MSVRADRVVESLPVPAFTAPVASVESPLPEQTRAVMGERFGHDFSQVRVHTDARAADRAGASAYTSGSRITFGAGRYAPGTPAGDRLIAHELAHVVQQSGPSDGASAGPSAWEGEADAAARSVMTGGRPRIDHRAPAGLVQCQAAPAPTQAAPTQAPGQAPSRAPTPLPERPPPLDPAGRPGFPVKAELYRDPYGPALLTVTLRTNITFAEHPPGAEPDGPVALPSAAAQATWKQKFHDRVGEVWSYKHYLDLDGPAPGEHPRAVVNVRAVEHGPTDVYITVYSWTPDSFRSHVGGNVMELAIGDVDETSGSHQIVATHEAGHSLGVMHIAGGTDNDMAAYGTFNRAADLMGNGPTVSVTDYLVFAEIMEQITHARWKVTPGIAEPHNFLPLAAGFVGAVLGAVLGGLLGGLGGPLGAFMGAAVGGAALGGGLAALFGLTGTVVS